MRSKNGTLWMVIGNGCWKNGVISSVQKVAESIRKSENVETSFSRSCHEDPSGEICLRYLFGLVIGGPNGPNGPKVQVRTLTSVRRLVCGKNLSQNDGKVPLQR
jgi:hypothetical protein